MKIKWQSMNDSERELLSLQLVEMCNKLTIERTSLKVERDNLLEEKALMLEQISEKDSHTEDLFNELHQVMEERSALIQSVRYLSFVHNFIQHNGGLTPSTVEPSTSTEKESIDKSLWT